MPFDGTEYHAEDETLRLLRQARALLVEKGWCQRHPALDGNGFSVETINDRAVAFCTMGAVMRVSTLAGSHYVFNPGLFTRLEEELPEDWLCIPSWNDCIERTKDEVLALYDRAIATRLAELEREKIHAV